MHSQAIVAIVGSAGSRSPLLQFFARPLLKEASFVILRHLPLSFQPELAAVLQRNGGLALRTIHDGMELKNNTVYVAPIDQYVSVLNDTFHVVPRRDYVNQGGDHFLRSLALAYGPRAIGVILSGLLKDGSQGIQALQDAGGLTLAQHPMTCSFPSMPESAIRTGCIDHVILVSQMADYIRWHVAALREDLSGDNREKLREAI